jgi:glycosyltransferase involved in cell wall biosynthesis
MQVIRPWSVLPLGRHWQAAHSVNVKLLDRQVSGSEGFESPDIWWMYDPVAVPIVEERKAQLVVYDCVDRHSAYGGYRGILDRLERRLLSQADIVFVTARGLEEHCAGTAETVHFLPNGYDEELFKIKTTIPDAMARIPRPRLGFVGGVAHWLDLDLVAAAARSRPDWSFVFVGPIGDVGATVPRASNIHWLGRCRREDVPAYVAGFDVGLIPFKETLLTKSVNPLKAYEYLAAGVPVVSTRLPELDDLHLIRQTRQLEEFIAGVEDALKDGKGDDRMKERRESVAEYSLQRTFEKMVNIVQDRLT